MGFLNFLTKRPQAAETDNDDAVALQAHAYESLVASIPPIRGTVPVPGNGTKAILNGHKLQTQPSVKVATPRHRISVARLRNSGLRRPTTAPSAPPRDPPRPRTSGDLAPRLELHQKPQKKDGPPYKLPPKDGPPYKLAPKPWTQPDELTRVTSYERLPIFSTIAKHTRTFSMGSRATTQSQPRGHVDLVDYQSTIKPLDFYDRVKATGARNYGEDVADRNMTEQMAWDSDSSDARRPRKRHSLGHGLRSTASEAFPALENEASEAHSSGLITKRKATKTSRRQSMPSYVLASSSTPSRNPNRPRTRLTPEDELAAFPGFLRDRATALARHELAILRDSAVRPTSSSSSQPFSQLESTRQQRLESRHTRPGSRGGETVQRPRTTSTASASLTMSSIKRLEVESAATERTASLCNSSMTSGTATANTYDYDSSAFRPQSSHTSNTSVDLTPFSPVSKVSDSSYRTAPDTYCHSREPSLHSRAVMQSPLVQELTYFNDVQPATDSFNIDDYISSDDSFGSPKRDRGEDEKDLLFCDSGFGLAAQLPGLPALIQTTGQSSSSSNNSQTQGLKAFCSPTTNHEPSFGYVSTMRSKPHRRIVPEQDPDESQHFRMPSFDYHDSDEGDYSGADADSEDDWSLDIPMSRSSPVRYVQVTSKHGDKSEPAAFSQEDEHHYNASSDRRPAHRDVRTHSDHRGNGVVY